MSGDLYLRKPITVHAIRVTGSNEDELSEFCGSPVERWSFFDLNGIATQGVIFVDEASGTRIRASVGDWLLRRIWSTVVYVKSDNVFRDSYEVPDED